MPQCVEQQVVQTYNEWDPLEEIIVGIVDGAIIPPWDIEMEATLHLSLIHISEPTRPY